jgi:hypothetical protein
MKKPNILGAGHDFGPFLFMLHPYNMALSYIRLITLLPVTYRLSLPSGHFANVFPTIEELLKLKKTKLCGRSPQAN